MRFPRRPPGLVGPDRENADQVTTHCTCNRKRHTPSAQVSYTAFEAETRKYVEELVSLY
jgi:hypothetical protein